MSIKFEPVVLEGYYITANSYQYKDKIKELGGIWMADKKMWFVYEDVKETLERQTKTNEKVNEKNEESKQIQVNTSSEIKIEEYKKGLLVSGNTSNYRDDLKNMGGLWNNTLSGWIFKRDSRNDLECFFNKNLSENSLANNDKKSVQVPKNPLSKELDNIHNHSGTVSPPDF